VTREVARNKPPAQVFCAVSYSSVCDVYVL